jgi:two-component system NarL family response regulator
MSAPGTRIRVLVADDHFVVRFGLVSFINSEPDMEVVGEAGNGQEAVDLFRAHRPDVVMLDLRMPGQTGVETIQAILREAPAARILVLTIHKEDEAIFQAIRAGARGYLLKDVPSQALLAAIRALHAGKQCIPPDIAAKIAERLASADITPREIQLLKLIANGLSNKRVAQRVGITENAVKRHLVAILAKLGAEDRTHAVTLALERGLIDLAHVRARE